jgi:hypothetical protein
VRCAMVAAFACGAYASIKRTYKPFNPILGETLEVELPDGAVYLAEQVHPPPPNTTMQKLRIVTGFRVGDRSRGRYATPADFPPHAGTPYRGLRVRRWGLGFVHRSRAIFSVAPCRT